MFDGNKREFTIIDPISWIEAELLELLYLIIN